MTLNKKEIANRIKSIRLTLGLTMEEFGKKLDTSKGAVNNWEKEKSLPNNERLKRIAELGNISVNELLYGSLDSYIVSTLEGSNEIKDDYNTIWLARNSLIITNRWKDSDFPNEEEVIKAYKAFKDEQLDIKEENILHFGKEIYEMASKRSDILSDLEHFENLSLDEKHKKLDEVSKHLKEVIYWYEKHFGFTPKEAYEDYNELYKKNNS